MPTVTNLYGAEIITPNEPELPLTNTLWSQKRAGSAGIGDTSPIIN